MTMNPEPQSDLLWDAFRYVAGEMPVEECEAFEERLAEDQSAREAIVQAVQLTQAVVSLPEEVPVAVASTKRNDSVSRRSAAWIAPAAIAACLLLAFGLLMNGPFPEKEGIQPSGSSRTSVDTENAGSLISYWSNSDATLESLLDEADSSEAALDEEQLEADLLSALGEPIEEITVPAWMLSAVAAEDQPDELLPESNQEEL